MHVRPNAVVWEACPFEHRRPEKNMIAAGILFHLLTWSSAQKEQLIYPSIVEERTTTTNLVLRLSDDITLNLEKSAVLADRLLFATATVNGHRLKTIDTTPIQENIYHDIRQQSSVRVLHENGRVEVEGIINDRLRIKPLPEAERSSQGQMLHSLYEVEEIKEDPEKMAFVTRKSVHRVLRRKRQLRHTARPAGKTNHDNFIVELHVISDSAHHESFSTEEELIAYLAVITNAVNLRFLDMQYPAITFRLVGVTRSLDDPFESHIVGTIDAYETLEGLANYYQKGKVPGNPDLVYLITNRNLASISKEGYVNKNVAGLAYIGGVCTHQRVGEGEDIARSYDGAHTMAHELAHLLGAQHDPKNKSECSWSHGFLLSYEDGGSRKYHLSNCSMRQIREVVRNRPFNCIEESPRTKYYMERFKKFPGQKIVENYYCRLILKNYGYGREVYSLKPAELSQKCKMRCYYLNRTLTYYREVDMLDGMLCDDTNRCKRGICGNHTWPQRNT
uniref:Peptidase M12B domain-containing protein n=1 Tax=Amblyomma maculatum TaxID=34609 RepID=G3MNG4_AMBMU